MKDFVEFTKAALIIGILTILTQVGGIVYLFYKPIGLYIEEVVQRKWIRLPIKILVFCSLLFVSSMWVVPRFAIGYGRVPLPVFASEELPLKPAGLWICLANRHYVKPELLETITAITHEIHKNYPNVEITYLDANFPFKDGFPLLPHRSHNDGCKLDICFLYQDATTGEMINDAPTWLGYGYSEGPKQGEYDQIRDCKVKGYWQYDLLGKLVNSKKKASFIFEEKANKTLLNIIAAHPKVEKIFVEPHLKTRMGLQKLEKIRFQGCQSVRHDDHIHLQI